MVARRVRHAGRDRRLGAGQDAARQRSALLTLDVGAVGASTGLLVGLENERRLRRLDRDATAAWLAAERAEERFDFLNHLLRHHLLNGLAVVRGYAELLSEDRDDSPEEVRVIQQRSDEIAALVRNVGSLAMAVSGDLARRPVDPAPQLREAGRRIQRRYPTADLDLCVETGLQVVGHDGLDPAFDALLHIAVEEADGEPITVRTAVRNATLVVTVAFDGAPNDRTIRVGDRGPHDERELGRFLAETLIEYVGGTVSEPTDGRRGLTVRLPTTE